MIATSKCWIFTKSNIEVSQNRPIGVSKNRSIAFSQNRDMLAHWTLLKMPRPSLGGCATPDPPFPVGLRPPKMGNIEISIGKPIDFLEIEILEKCPGPIFQIPAQNLVLKMPTPCPGPIFQTPAKNVLKMPIPCPDPIFKFPHKI